MRSYIVLSLLSLVALVYTTDDPSKIELKGCEDLKDYYEIECKSRKDEFTKIAQACMKSPESEKLLKDWIDKAQFPKVS